jgi:hypothetical protein
MSNYTFSVSKFEWKENFKRVVVGWPCRPMFEPWSVILIWRFETRQCVKLCFQYFLYPVIFQSSYQKREALCTFLFSEANIATQRVHYPAIHVFLHDCTTLMKKGKTIELLLTTARLVGITILEVRASLPQDSVRGGKG